MRVVVLMAAAVAMSASSSIAQDTPSSWRVPPAASGDDFPDLAVLLGIDGSVVLKCIGTALGQVEDCTVQSESPSGLGFGDRAIEVVRRGTLNPAISDGQAVSSSFDVAVPFVTVRLRLEPRPAWRGLTPTPEATAAAEIIAKQMLDGLPDLFVPRIEAPADRKALIESWFQQEGPSPIEAQRIMATVLTRSMTEEDLMALSQGRPSMRGLPTVERMEKSFRDLVDPNVAAIRVRARYCARFGCEITPPSPAG